MGGGFGGVILHLVPAGLKEEYLSGIGDAYRERFGLEAKVVEVRPGIGARYEGDADHRRADQFEPAFGEGGT